MIIPASETTIEQHVCDDCGARVVTNGLGKPRGWAKVLQKGDAPPKHYCNACKPQKKKS